LHIETDFHLRRWQSWGSVFNGVYLSVYLHNISKIDADRITKLDIQIFHSESGKPILLGSKVKVTRHKNSASVSHCTLVSAGFF